jgi:hypothetical protein
VTYTPTTWVANTTVVSAVHMNNIEGGIVNAVPADDVVAAGTRIVASKLLAADAQPAFQINGDGKHLWGPGGATVPDTSLYRTAAQQLRTNADFYASRDASGYIQLQPAPSFPYLKGIGNNPSTAAWASGAGVALYCGPTGTEVGWEIYTQNAVDGLVINWNSAGANKDLFMFSPNGFYLSDGVAGWDTRLYRSAAAALATNGSLLAGGGISSNQNAAGGSAFSAGNLAASGYVLVGARAGDTNYRVELFNDGTLSWGPGNAAQDVDLYRSATDLLMSDDDLEVRGGSAYRIRVGFVGGPNAPGLWIGAAYDTNLYRSAANTLKTDGVLIGDHQSSVASVTTARTGGAAAALPAAPVKYLALRDETGARVYVPAYS